MAGACHARRAGGLSFWRDRPITKARAVARTAVSPASFLSRTVTRAARPRIRPASPGWAARCVVVALGCATLQPAAFDNARFQRAAQARGTVASDGARALQELLASLAGADDLGRLAAVNRFFNRRIVFADDVQVWGEEDHWSTPLEVLAQGRGDCEDYVIAKYFGLLALGMPTARLRLVYVRAQVGGARAPPQAHMVLAYYAAPDSEPLVLDNLVAEIRPASQRRDLEPVFSFNSDGLWQGVGAQTAGNPMARLSRWRELLTRVRAEGFE